MKLSSLLVFTVIPLTACAAARVVSSGVQQIGPEKYTVTVSVQGMKPSGQENSAKTRTKAISDANAFCTQKGLSYASVSREEIEKSETATAIVNFTCEK